MAGTVWLPNPPHWRINAMEEARYKRVLKGAPFGSLEPCGCLYGKGSKRNETIGNGFLGFGPKGEGVWVQQSLTTMAFKTWTQMHRHTRLITQHKKGQFFFFKWSSWTNWAVFMSDSPFRISHWTPHTSSFYYQLLVCHPWRCILLWIMHHRLSLANSFFPIKVHAK